MNLVISVFLLNRYVFETLFFKRNLAITKEAYTLNKGAYSFNTEASSFNKEAYSFNKNIISNKNVVLN